MQFVENKGNLKKLNKTCVENEAPLNWKTPDAYYNTYFGTDDGVALE